MSTPIVSIDILQIRSRKLLCTLGLNYNQGLSEMIPQLKKVLNLSDTAQFDIVNIFNQKIPLNYRVRTDLEVFLSIYSS